MTPAEESDALALLRAACEYAGRPWDARVSDVEWMIELHGKRFFACGLDILRPPYCDTLLGEILRRLRKDGWQPGIDYQHDRARWECDLSGNGVYGHGTDPDHLILALAHAMRDAVIISTETKT